MFVFKFHGWNNTCCSGVGPNRRTTAAKGIYPVFVCVKAASVLAATLPSTRYTTVFVLFRNYRPFDHHNMYSQKYRRLGETMENTLIPNF